MAKIRKGIFGPLQGKLGPVVGSTWKGIPYVREASVNEGQPIKRSAAQVANQAKFKFINDWLVPFHPFFTVGFKLEAARKTEIAAALSANYKTVFIGQWPEISINYEALKISRGELPSLGRPKIEFTNAQELSLSWENGVFRDCQYTDQVSLALYSPELKITDGFVCGVYRALEQYHHKLDLRLIGQPLEVYLSVCSLDRKRIANTTYLGRITP